MIWNKKKPASLQLSRQVYDALSKEKNIDFTYKRTGIIENTDAEISDFIICEPQKVSSSFLLRLSYLIWLPMAFLLLLFLPFKWLFTGTLKFETTGHLGWFLNWHDKIMKHKY